MGTGIELGETRSTWIVWAQQGSGPVKETTRHFHKAQATDARSYAEQLLDTYDLVGINSDTGTTWHRSQETSQETPQERPGAPKRQVTILLYLDVPADYSAADIRTLEDSIGYAVTKRALMPGEILAGSEVQQETAPAPDASNLAPSDVQPYYGN